MHCSLTSSQLVKVLQVPWCRMMSGNYLLGGLEPEFVWDQRHLSHLHDLTQRNAASMHTILEPVYYQYNCCKVRSKVTSSAAGGAGKPGACVVEVQDIILGTESHGLGEWSKTSALGRVRRDGTWSVSGLWESSLGWYLEMQVTSLLPESPSTMSERNTSGFSILKWW